MLSPGWGWGEVGGRRQATGSRGPGQGLKTNAKFRISLSHFYSFGKKGLPNPFKLQHPATHILSLPPEQLELSPEGAGGGEREREREPALGLGGEGRQGGHGLKAGCLSVGVEVGRGVSTRGTPSSAPTPASYPLPFVGKPPGVTSPRPCTLLCPCHFHFRT